MAKNYMPEIAKMLGVEIGERFKVRKEDSEIYYFTDVAFLKQVNDAESEDFVSDLEEEDLLVLYYLLSGKETVVKIPWEPKISEDEEKKQLNEAISIIREYCDEKRICDGCPLQEIFCYGDDDDPRPPYSWPDID